MDEGTLAELALGMVMVFGVFMYLYPGTQMMGFLIAAAAFVGVIYFVRGVIEFALGKPGGIINFWAGVVFIVMVILLYGGMPYVMKMFSYVGLAAGTIAAIILKLGASLV
jgi:hypothetical protein